jgi:hypothetical protein
MVGLLEFSPSVNDNERYVQIIAPWFLNMLNKMSNSNTSAGVRKIDVFDKASKAHLGGFRGDKKQFENYVGTKGSKVYSDLIGMVVDSLVDRGFVRRAVNPAEIMITQEGINMCNTKGETGWHASDYSVDYVC